jgi:hypothetical protein
MIHPSGKSQGAKAVRKAVRVAAVGMAMAAFGLAGCSTMPAWTKPSTWYDSVTGDPAQVEQAAREKDAKLAAQAPAGDFPNLAQTPSVPVVSTTPAQRKDIRDSLAADRDRTAAAAAAAKAIETPESRAAAEKAR